MTLTKRLLLLAMISVLPAITIWTYTEVSLRRAREAEVNDLALRQARLAGSEVERIFDGIESLLIAVGESPSVQNFNSQACNSYLEGLQRRVPQLLFIAVLDRNEEVRCGSGSISQKRFSKNLYFQEAVSKNRFVIGAYTTEFTGGRPGPLPALTLALPIRSDDGEAIGTIATALDLTWLSGKLRERALSADGSLTIADRNITIIAREPFPERFLGTKIPEPFLKYVTGDKIGVFEAVSQDGVRRILGYIPLALAPENLYISTGFSSQTAFDAINRAAWHGFMLIAAALVLALSLSWLTGRAFITRPFEMMTDAIRAWRRGDYDVRIALPGSPGELGVLSNAFNDLMDDVATRQKALQTSEEQTRLALEAGHMGTWWYDHGKKVGGWSSQAAALLGLPAEQTSVSIQEWRSLLHPDDLERALAKLRAATQGDGHYEDEYRIRRPDGEARWINSKGRVFLSPLKKPVYFIGVLHDITARKEAETQQRFFLDELNHRVKNTLATIQSIASQTLRSSSDLAGFRSAFEDRLLALSKTHDLLTRNAWRDANLQDLAEQELAPYRKKDDERIIIRGPSINLPARYAINLGLILHELVTNAAKYGALSTPSGRVEFRWSITPGPDHVRHLELHWRETDGPPVTEPKHQGFGTKLIRRSIEGELSGSLSASFAPAGACYDISVPLPSRS